MKKRIITISRQFGSGGRGIGKLLADRLDIPFYDKELIEMASKESGIDERIFKSDGEETGRFYQVIGAIGYALGSPAGGIYEYSINDQLYLVQSNIIEKIAEEGPCVIVGRCADYVLEDREDVLNIYLCAGIDERLRRVIDEYHVEDDAGGHHRGARQQREPSAHDMARAHNLRHRPRLSRHQRRGEAHPRACPRLRARRPLPRRERRGAGGEALLPAGLA